MTQLSLFETSRQISISDDIVAVNFKGRWELYMAPGHAAGYDAASGLERFSHFATPAESLACYFGRSL
jgi:hypothetical protein